MKIRILLLFLLFLIQKERIIAQNGVGIGHNFTIRPSANEQFTLYDSAEKALYTADLLLPCHYEKGKILVKNKGFWGMIDTTLRTIFAVEYVAPFDDFEIEYNQNEAYCTKGRIFGLRNKQGLWGGLDSEGKTIIPFQFQNIELLMNSEDSMRSDEKVHYSKFHDAYAQTDKGVFQINASGKTISERIADTLLRSSSPDVMMLKDRKLVAYNNNNKTFQDFSADEYAENKVFYNGQKSAFCNTNGERLTSFIYDEIGVSEEDVYPVRIGKNWGIYNTKIRKYSVEPTHLRALMTSSAKHFIVKNTAQKWAVIEAEKPEIQNFVYDSIVTSSYGTIGVRKGKKWAIFYENNGVTDFLFDGLDLTSIIGYIIVTNEGKYGLWEAEKNKMIFKSLYSAFNRIDDPIEGTLKIYGTRDKKRHWLNLDDGKEND